MSDDEILRLRTCGLCRQVYKSMYDAAKCEMVDKHLWGFDPNPDHIDPIYIQRKLIMLAERDLESSRKEVGRDLDLS